MKESVCELCDKPIGVSGACALHDDRPSSRPISFHAACWYPEYGHWPPSREIASRARFNANSKRPNAQSEWSGAASVQAMRYIVITGYPAYPGDPCMLSDIQGVTVCEDEAQVETAINAIREFDGGDWTVFELVKGKFEQRSVCFEPDGTTVKSIQ